MPLLPRTRPKLPPPKARTPLGRLQRKQRRQKPPCRQPPRAGSLRKTCSRSSKGSAATSEASTAIGVRPRNSRLTGSIVSLRLSFLSASRNRQARCFEGLEGSALPHRASRPATPQAAPGGRRPEDASRAAAQSCEGQPPERICHPEEASHAAAQSRTGQPTQGASRAGRAPAPEAPRSWQR